MTVTIHKSSWHYKLAHATGYKFWDDDSLDICHYLRHLFVMGILFILALAFVVAVSVILGDFIGWAVACLVALTWIMPIDGAAVVVGTLCLASVFGLSYLSWRGTAKAVDTEFLVAAADSIHNKFCTKIRVE